MVSGSFLVCKVGENAVVVGNMTVVHIADNEVVGRLKGVVVEGIVNKFGSFTERVAGKIDFGKIVFCFLVGVLELFYDARIHRTVGLGVEVAAENGGILCHLFAHYLENHIHLQRTLGVVVPVGVAVDVQGSHIGELILYNGPDTASGAGVAFKLGFFVGSGGHVETATLQDLITVFSEIEGKSLCATVLFVELP